jgi:hydroxymethylglutaryl-CoA reductase (NADPH)
MSSHISWQNLSTSDDASDQVKARQDWITSVSGRQNTYPDLFSHQLNVETITKKNCENLIGSVEVPVGVAGPLTFTYEDKLYEVIIPLATTEGALVASVNRGCKALTQSHNAQVVVEKRGMSRSPVFECVSGKAAQEFLHWFEAHIDQVKRIAESTSSHLHLVSHHAWVRGRYVFVRFAFDTEEAMGMNMVTIALQKALDEALERHPEIKLVSLSSNVCTDKKDSVVNSLLGRGYWVQSEAILSTQLIADVLKTTPAKLVQVHVQKNLIGSNVAGSFSQNAHVANVLSAMYIATGQDPAHVVEGSKAFLMLEEHEQGLYAALTLPNINVGVVGGGTQLAAQRQARQMMSPREALTAVQLAAIVGMAALAGEISLMAALAEQQLAYAHAKLGQGKIL